MLVAYNDRAWYEGKATDKTGSLKELPCEDAINKTRLRCLLWSYTAHQLVSFIFFLCLPTPSNFLAKYIRGQNNS